MTQKLYYNDPYMLNFSQKIISKKNYGQKYSTVFAETYFYPTSGGQMHDTGTINGIPVLEVIEEGDEILHITDREVQGDFAECKIDSVRRLDFMQQHTGQHILSYAITKVLGADTVSSHLGEEGCTIDINLPSITLKDFSEIEKTANEIIWKNCDIKVHYIHDSEVDKYPLRKAPKFKGELRIIEIDGLDYSACGGTHVQKSGEVGIIKLLKTEKVKGNLTRLEFLCGRRALNDYQWKSFILNEAALLFTTSERDLPEKIKKLIEDNKTLNKQIEVYKTELLSIEVLSILKEASVENGYRLVNKIFRDRNLNEIRFLAQKITENEGYIVILGAIGNTSNIIMARSKDININMVQLFNSIAPLIGAKGGGKPDFVQAGLMNPEKLEEAISFVMRNTEI